MHGTNPKIFSQNFAPHNYVWVLFLVVVKKSMGYPKILPRIEILQKDLGFERFRLSPKTIVPETFKSDDIFARFRSTYREIFFFKFFKFSKNRYGVSKITTPSNPNFTKRPRIWTFQTPTKNLSKAQLLTPLEQKVTPNTKIGFFLP